jgi:carboxylesterase
MIATGWDDWAGEAEAAYQRLARRPGERVVVAGQSMGGSLALWLAARHPEIAGVVGINPATLPADREAIAMVRDMLGAGEDRLPAARPDIAKPGARDDAYNSTPLAPLLSYMAGLSALQADFARVSCPVLIMTSANDHVLDPMSSDHLAASVRGPVERLVLARSYHVATLDYDAPLICRVAVDFARKATAR